MENYYFTFGSSSTYPFQDGWITIKAPDMHLASEMFKSTYPNPYDEDMLNCAFVYSEEEFKETEMYKQQSNRGYDCHGCFALDYHYHYGTDLPLDRSNFAILLPGVSKDKGNMILVREGIGVNLSNEDIEEGYVDYIYYDVAKVNHNKEEEDIEILDGGMVLLKKPFRKYTFDQVIQMTMDMAGVDIKTQHFLVYASSYSIILDEKDLLGIEEDMEVDFQRFLESLGMTSKEFAELSDRAALEANESALLYTELDEKEEDPDIDDDLDSYSTIWNGAVSDTSKGDRRRVVTALKNISEGTDLET